MPRIRPAFRLLRAMGMIPIRPAVASVIAGLIVIAPLSSGGQ
jgi:hypothetical protein